MIASPIKSSRTTALATIHCVPKNTSCPVPSWANCAARRSKLAAVRSKPLRSRQSGSPTQPSPLDGHCPRQLNGAHSRETPSPAKERSTDCPAAGVSEASFDTSVASLGSWINARCASQSLALIVPLSHLRVDGSVMTSPSALETNHILLSSPSLATSAPSPLAVSSSPFANVIRELV